MSQVRELTQAQQAIRDLVEGFASESRPDGSRLSPGRVLEQFIRGYFGVESAAWHWDITVAELRELMAEYDVEDGAR